MAATATLIEALSSTGSGDQIFAAFTPTANSVLVVLVGARGNPATITGVSDSPGLTWEEIVIAEQYGSFGKVAGFWANTGAAPQLTTITVDLSVTGSNVALWQIVDAGGAVIRQYKESRGVGVTTDATFDVVLHTDNAYLALAQRGPGLAGTLNAGWTEDQNTTYTGPDNRSLAGHRSQGETTALDVGWFGGSSATWTIIIVECGSSGQLSSPLATVKSNAGDLVVSFAATGGVSNLAAISPLTERDEQDSLDNTIAVGDSTGVLPEVETAWSVAKVDWCLISLSLRPATDWTEAVDVLSMPAPTWERGLPGATILDLVADTGVLTFSLDNSPSNSAGLAGRYSPAHANALAGFEDGMPVKVVTTAATAAQMFRGTIAAIRPSSGLFDEPMTEVEVHDWVGYLGGQELGVIAVSADQRADQAIATALANILTQPVRAEFGEGVETFGYVFSTDAPNMSMASIFQKMARNEFGRVYLKADGSLVFENRHVRPTTLTSAFTLDGVMSELQITYERAAIANIVQVRIYPAYVDPAATTVLWQPSNIGTPKIGPGETLVFKAVYRDPIGKNLISAIDIEDPVETVEFGSVGNFVADDLAAFLSQVNVVGAHAMLSSLTNSSSKTGYLNDFQIKGRGIYTDSPILIEVRDQDSINAGAGERRLALDLEQITDIQVGQNYAGWTLGVLSLPHINVRRIVFLANQTSALAAAALAVEVSSRFTLIESVTGLSEDFFVQRLKYTQIGTGLLVEILAVPAKIYKCWIWDSSTWDNDDQEGWAL